MWEIEVEYRSAQSGQLLATEKTVETICANDRLGLSAYVTTAGVTGSDRGGSHAGESQFPETACAGSIDDDGLELSCTSEVTRGTCRLAFAVDLRADRAFDVLNGVAEWRMVQVVGACAALLDGTSPGENVQIRGLRLSRSQEACSAPPASLVEKFLSHPGLMRLLPPPIEGLTARADGRTAGLRWKAVPGAAAYEIYRAVGNAAFERIGHIRATGKRPRFTFRDVRLARGTTYRYVVRWIDPGGRESPSSNVVSVTPAVGRR